MRLRKKPHTDEKLKQFADFVTGGDVQPITKNPARELYVELGTGKGDFITQIAERNPQINFIGLEVEATCVLAAASTGKWRMVKPMAFAAIAAGADGLMMEVHPNPARALSDGSQSLTPEHYRAVMKGIKKLAAFMREENLIGLDEE